MEAYSQIIGGSFRVEVWTGYKRTEWDHSIWDGIIGGSFPVDA